MMCDVFREHFPRLPGESGEQLEALMLDEIIALNGQPSIRQCERLAEMVRTRGGPHLDPETKRAEFQHRLDEAIVRRTERIRSGQVSREDYLIAGARDFLEQVRQSGITPAILSSTVQDRLETEAALLGIDHYFGRHIYGSSGDPLKFTKRAVFERLLQEEEITGAGLLAFGDGPTEIRDATELGGIAIAICSDEDHNGSGLLDERKSAQLRSAGAVDALPDYRNAGALLDRILGR